MIRLLNRSLKQVCFVSVLVFLFLANSPLLMADGSSVIRPVPITGAYKATFREDQGTISIIEFAGNYDRDISGQFNVEPRAVVAREFFRTHPDNYDFVVVFSSFEFNTGNALAFHAGVQNKVQGIGLEQFDNSKAFGSNGRLQGYIDMAALSRYVTDPLDPRFDDVLMVLGHEILHQWSGRTRFDQGAGPETGLIGRQNAHWSNLLDSSGSVLYGHKWRNNGNGTFTSVAAQKFFSPLDLYLAGLYRASEVPPMTLIVNPEIDPQLTPSESQNIHGSIISGAARTVTIENIIAAEGARVPAYEQTQKDFRLAFVMLVGQNEQVSPRQLGAINMVRRSFMDRFSIWTGGRATAEVFPEGIPGTGTGGPVVVVGGDVRTDPVSIEAGFFWLRNQQTQEGYWQDKVATLLRDSTVSLEVLSKFDSNFVRRQQGLEWLQTQQAKNTDFYARQASVLDRAGMNEAAKVIRDTLLISQNKDGGWGIEKNFDSNPLDTALAVDALFGHADLTAAISYLVNSRNPDGGWSYLLNGLSRTTVTTTVLQTLKKVNRHEAVTASAINFLVSKQNADGGFGDSPSTVHDTSNALQTFVDFKSVDRIRTDDASSYLLARQDKAGSWDGSTYTTAITLAALQKFSFPNWSLDTVITVEPTLPNDGDRVKLSVTVKNDGNLPTPQGKLRLYNGNPSSGGTQISTDLIVPLLASGTSVSLYRYWDTFNLAGEHNLFALVDPDEAQVEMSERDNTATVTVRVAAAPAGIDLSVVETDIAVMPAKPNTLPTSLAFAVTLRNLGREDASNVLVQLRKGSVTGEVVDGQILNIGGRTTIATNFTHVLTTAGLTDFYIVIDPLNTITEVSETNNSAGVRIETVNSLDLAIAASDITIDKQSPLVGEDVTFTIKLHNFGTLDTPPSKARYLISDGTSTAEIQTNEIQIAAGKTLAQTVTWRVNKEAALTFTVQLDPENVLPELNELNNTASLSFASGKSTGPNLVVNYRDFTFNPTPGLERKPLTLSALVRNTGTLAASNIEFAFYNGDPTNGGVLIGYANPIVNLGVDSSASVSYEWTKVPNARDQLLYVLVDPNNSIIEFSETDNQAFNVLSVLSLPDLAISRGDLTFIPPFPRDGETVKLNARISNLGKQSVAAAIVRFYSGDPANGGTQIGADHSIAIAGNDAVIISTDFVLPSNKNDVDVFVVIDPNNAIDESSKLNNTANRKVAVQDGDFYVSHRFFSPDGNGKQDAVEFFFRLQTKSKVEIAVINWRNEEVRRFAGSGLSNISEGSVVWDGLDELGRVVYDGAYRFQVYVAANKVGEANVEVDINRSPILQALNTPYEQFTNLTCQLNHFSNFTPTKDEESIFFSIPYTNTNTNQDIYPRGVYRMDSNGAEIRPIVPESFFEQEQSEVPDDNELFVSHDGAMIAFWVRDYRNWWQRNIWLVDSDGKNLRKLIRNDLSEVIGFAADNKSLLTIIDGTLYSAPLNTEPLVLIADLDSHIGGSGEGFNINSYQFSPDNTKLLLVIRSWDINAVVLLHVNLANGLIQTIAQSDRYEARYVENYWKSTWTIDGSKFAAMDPENQAVNIYNADGHYLQRVLSPEINSEESDRSFSGAAWSSRNDEIAFMVFAGQIEPEGSIASRSSSASRSVASDLGGIYTANLITGEIDLTHAFVKKPNSEDYIGPSPFVKELLWAPNERSLLYHTGRYYYYYDEYAAVWAFKLDDAGQAEIIFEKYWKDNNQFDKPQFSATGRQLLFDSRVQSRDPSSVCYYEHGEEMPVQDSFSYRSLLNLTADLRAIRSQRVGGIILSGSAVDKNFDYYVLDYASTDVPNVWSPIQPASGQFVIDDQFTVWIPPRVGSYFVRLRSFDLAGNMRQKIKRVSWGEIASITDIYREPAIFSPNGDGIKDISTVQYRVLQPVHLEFNFYNSQGDLVRSFIRDHASFGDTYSFHWDGRDSNGIRVPDGRYRMMVQNYEFFFTVDATPPVVTLELLDAYQRLDINPPVGPVFVDVRPEMHWSVKDDGYLDSVVNRVDPKNLNNISTFVDIDPKEDAKGILRSASMTVAQVANSLYQVVAEDKAGNKTITAPKSGKEQIIIHQLGTHAALAGTSVELKNRVFAPLRNLIYTDFDSITGSAPPISVNQNGVRFSIFETIFSNFSNVELQYRKLSDTEWQTASFEKYLTSNVVTDELTINNLSSEFQAVWRPTGVSNSETFVVRLKATDLENKIFFSNSAQLSFSSSFEFRGLSLDASPDNYSRYIRPLLKTPLEIDEYILWGKEDLPEPLLEVRLYIQSNEDPRYAINREAGVSFNPDESFIFRTKELKSCTTYQAYIVGKTTNQRYQTTSLAIRMPCLDFRAKSEPVEVDNCNEPSKKIVTIFLAPSSKDGRELKLLTVAPESDPLNVLYNVNKPISVPIADNRSKQGYSHSFELNTSGLPEGLINFTARLVNVDDQVGIYSFNVMIDHTPPVLHISYPLQDGRVCGIQRTLQDGRINNVLTLDGLITDANSFHYAMEVAKGPDINASPYVFHQSQSLDSFRAANGEDPQIYPPHGKFNSGNVVGPLGELFNRNGEMSVRLSVNDKGGFKQCTVRTFIFDGIVELTSYSTDLKLFSPNGDNVFDEVNVNYITEENIKVDIDVYNIRYDHEGRIVKIGESIKQLEKDTLVFAGEMSSIWDGANNSGSVLGDGQYLIEMIATDTCGNKKVSRAVVELDNTPPAVNISYPTTGSRLPMIIEVQGSITDKNIQGYSVEYGQTFSPDNWLRLSAATGNVIDKKIALWNTFGQEGDHTLRVFASDRVGNETTLIIPLSLATRVELITYLEAIEPLFSPNDDGRRDSSNIRLGLNENSIITLVIKDQQARIVRGLAVDQSMNKGAFVFNWDGLDNLGNLVIDGIYTAYVKAAFADDPTNIQEEEINIVVDTTPPTIAITRPNTNFIQGVGAVIGTVQDLNIESYTVSLTETPNAPAWVVIAEDSANRVNGILGSLEDLDEVEYALKIEAVDKAETRSEKIIKFTVDNTTPVVTLNQPEENLILGARKSPVKVSGSVEEKNPAAYEVNFAKGQNPTTFTNLISSETFPLPELLTEWDITQLLDGIYTLQFRVIDKVGLRGEARRLLTIDNTAPIAVITSPLNNGYVTKAMKITGSASDDNMLEYGVSIASGKRGDSELYSQLGLGTQNITEGVLIDWNALPLDGIYTLKLVVKDKADNVAEYFTEVIVDTLPPAKPTGLTAKVENRQDVLLNWNANTETDLAGYIVYRAGVRITPELIRSTTFTDREVAEGRYAYTVVAVDKAGLLSEKSDPASVVIDLSPPIAKLISPVNGAWVSGLLDIKGSAYSQQEDFKEYRLSVFSTATPDAKQLLRRSPVPIQADVLADWNTVFLPEGEQYTIQLEADDINGNTATNEITVKVDNLPPATPTGLVATATGANVQLNWNANTEVDLLGYLVFRNERIANASGSVVGDLKPYAIVLTTYLDIALADGDYVYTIVAIDQAGNTSDASLPAEVTIDTRAPHMTFIQPLDGSKFETPLYVLTTSPDTDIARVLYQYRGVGSSIWIDINPVDEVAPYGFSFDPVVLGLSYGSFQLTAIASDKGGRTDTAPSVISVIYRDMTRPAVVTEVVAKVNGGDVNLTWKANTEVDLTGYLIKRRLLNDDNEILLTADPIIDTRYLDADLDDAHYLYTVTAVDTSANQADPSLPTAGVVYTPLLDQPYTPTRAVQIRFAGKGIGLASLVGEVINANGTATLPPVKTNQVGEFSFDFNSLTDGDNTFVIRLRDSVGNISKPVSSTITKGDVPSQPTGLTALVTGYNVALNWNPNPESNILGYKMIRNEAPLFEPVLVSRENAVASSNAHIAVEAIDGNEYSVWYPDIEASSVQPAKGEWLEISWTDLALITHVEINWYDVNYRATAFDIQAWSGHNWVTVSKVTNNAAGLSKIELPLPYVTNKLRVVIQKIAVESAYDGAVSISEFNAYYQPLAANPSFNDSDVGDGHHRYAVTAINTLGYESIPSALVEVQVGDVEPPEAVVLSATVTESNVLLNWTASSSTDVARYDIYRDGQRIANITDLLNLAYEDVGLANGEYRYLVKPVDNAGNVGTSNEVVVTVAVSPPIAPINLALTVDITGRAMLLNWEIDASAVFDHYQVLRSTQQGGPYNVIANVSDTNYRDDGLTNGTQYFYIVLAVDNLGNTSLPSNEVSGIPRDEIVPTTPSILKPTVPGKLFSTIEPQVTIEGIAEPNVKVQLIHDGQLIAETNVIPTTTQIDLTDANKEYDDPIISPDGQSFVYKENVNSQIRSMMLYDYQTQSESLLLRVSRDGDFDPRWSFDGKKIFFSDYDQSTGNNYIRSVELETANAITITDPENSNIYNSQIMADNSHLVAYGEVTTSTQSGEGFWLLNIATGNWAAIDVPNGSYYLNNEIVLSDNNRFLAYSRWMGNNDELVVYDFLLKESIVVENQYSVDSLQWSPDSQALTFVRYNNIADNYEIVLYDVNLKTYKVVDGLNYIDNLLWSPDGQLIAYLQENTFTRKFELWVYDITTGAHRSLTNGQFSVADPRWSPQGDSIYFIQDNRTLIKHEMIDGVQTSLVSDADNIWELQSYASGYLTVSIYDSSIGRTQFARITPPSTIFTFESVQLNVGDNNFAVKAIDDGGNNSPLSESIIVNYRIGNKPDLDIGENGVRILPAAPVKGQETRITVVVRNTGDTVSPESQLSLVVINPRGNSQPLLDRVTVSPIAALSTRSIAVPWTVGNLAGKYNIVAVADPDNFIEEISEANNFGLLEVLVSDQQGPIALVSTDALTYSVNQTVNVTARINNAGSAFSGRAEILIVDAGDYSVASLMTQIITNLPYGGQINLNGNWSAGLTFAGLYKAVVNVYNLQNQLVTTNTSGFTIIENATLLANISTDRASYAGNSNVRTTTQITYSSGNVIIDNASATIRILNSSDVVLAESTQVLAELSPDSNTILTFDWNTAISPMGEYRAVIQVNRGTQEVANANTLFSINADAVLITGDLVLSSDRLDAGSPQLVNYTVRNISNSAIAQLPIRISLIDTERQQILQSNSLNVDIASSATVQGSVSFLTVSLALKSYSILLQAEYVESNGQSAWQRLASKDFLLVDREAPLLNIQSPSQNEFVKNTGESRVYAIDRLSRIAKVETRIDGGLWQALIIRDVAESLYGKPLSPLVDGDHTIEARAFDMAGNMAQTLVTRFHYDQTAPLITIQGVNEGGWYKAAVAPVITITDVNLAQTTITLNGVPYISGTAIMTEGQYLLAINATDKAGNTSIQTVTFSLDLTLPVINISGVTDGQSSETNITPIIEIIEANIATQSITLNGLPFISGTEISEQNDYVLHASVTDLAGNASSVTVNFKIRRIPLTLQITSPQNGASLSTSRVDIIGLTLANKTVTLRMPIGSLISVNSNEQGGFRFPQVNLDEGSNIFKLTAKDEAGNTSPTVTLTVYRVSAELKAEINKSARVLVWLPTKGESALATRIRASLDAMPEQDYAIVRSESDFIQQLRTKRFDSLLLVNVLRGGDDDDDRDIDGNKSNNSLGALRTENGDDDDDCEDDDDDFQLNSYSNEGSSTNTALEIKANVAAGMGLIMINSGRCQSRELTDVLGANTKESLRSINLLKLEESIATKAIILSVNGGSGVQLQATTGTAIGKLNNRYPALVINNYFSGKTALLGFNPADVADVASAELIIQNLVRYAKSTSTVLLPGSIAEITWTASKMTPPFSAVFRSVLPAEMVFISAVDGSVSSGQSAEWSRNINSETTRFTAFVRLPAQKGEYTITGRLLRSITGSEIPLVSAEFKIGLTTNRQDFAAEIMSALEIIKNPKPCKDDIKQSDCDDDKKSESKVEQAKQLIQSALNRSQHSIADAEYSINKLLTAYHSLTSVKDLSPRVFTALGHLVETYQVQWYGFFSSEGAPPLFTFIAPDQDVLNVSMINLKWYDQDIDSA